MFETLVLGPGGANLEMDQSKLHSLICTVFTFCYLWSVGGNISEVSWDAFDTFLRNQFDDNGDAKVLSFETSLL